MRFDGSFQRIGLDRQQGIVFRSPEGRKRDPNGRWDQESDRFELQDRITEGEADGNATAWAGSNAADVS